jgi:hypothetical protein
MAERFDKSRQNLAYAAAPAPFVFLWSSGFIAAKAGLAHAETLMFQRALCIGHRVDDRSRNRHESALGLELARGRACRGRWGDAPGDLFWRRLVGHGQGSRSRCHRSNCLFAASDDGVVL